MEDLLTMEQRGRFEHYVKLGMLDALHKDGLLPEFVYMEAVRIQNEKDRKFFHQGAN